MRGKVAKALRQIVGYTMKEKTEYVKGPGYLLKPGSPRAHYKQLKQTYKSGRIKLVADI